MAASQQQSAGGDLGWSLGPYFIIRSIGSGKFGTVYHATERPSGRDVALKLVPLDGAESDEKVEAERLGAQLQQKFGLKHKGLVPDIYEHGPRASFYAIAMELVRGEPLRDVVARGAIASRRAAEIALSIARFLEHAHRFETDIETVHYGLIVHADLKPDHILLMPSGEIRVLDFGIAKALAERTAVTTNKWGSMPYASPERLQSDGHVNEHADFWSLGVMLFEMAAGFRPYRRLEHNPSRLNTAILAHETMEALPPDIDPPMAAIIRKLLAPQIERRYSSAKAIADDLDAYLASRETVAAAETARASEQTVRIAPGGGTGAKPAATTPAASPAAAAGALTAAAQNAASAAVAAAPAVAAAQSSLASAAGPTPATTPVPASQWPKQPPPIPRLEPVPTEPIVQGPAIPATEAVPAGARLSGSRIKTAAPARRGMFRRYARLAAVFAGSFIIVSEGVALTRAERVREQVAAIEIGDIEAARQDYDSISDWSPLGIAEARVGGPLVDRMVELSNRIINEYRVEIPQVAQVQWEQAREALAFAAEIDNTRLVRSKRLVVNAHLKRIVARNRAELESAVRDFEEAARLDRESPDPYLGLARIYAYDMRDLDALTTAINEAQERGYTAGRRERAQLGDGYLNRGERAREAAGKLTGDARTEQLQRARDAFAQCIAYFDGLRFRSSDDNLRTCRRRLAVVETALAAPVPQQLPELPPVEPRPSALQPEPPPPTTPTRPPDASAERPRDPTATAPPAAPPSQAPKQRPVPRPFPTPPMRVPAPATVPAAKDPKQNEQPENPVLPKPPVTENPVIPKPPSNESPILPKPPGNRPPGGPGPLSYP